MKRKYGISNRAAPSSNGPGKGPETGVVPPRNMASARAAEAIRALRTRVPRTPDPSGPAGAPASRKGTGPWGATYDLSRVMREPFPYQIVAELCRLTCSSNVGGAGLKATHASVAPVATSQH